jgi:hypothetical protein
VPVPPGDRVDVDVGPLARSPLRAAADDDLAVGDDPPPLQIVLEVEL